MGYTAAHKMCIVPRQTDPYYKGAVAGEGVKYSHLDSSASMNASH
jgi:hypothetical protein